MTLTITAPTTEKLLHGTKIPGVDGTYVYTWDKGGVEYYLKIPKTEDLPPLGEVWVMGDGTVKLLLRRGAVLAGNLDRLIETLTLARVLIARNDVVATTPAIAHAPGIADMLATIMGNLPRNGALTPLEMNVLAVASDHPRSCRCGLCLRWLVICGPDDTGQGWSYYPFTEAEYVEAGGEVKPYYELFQELGGMEYAYLDNLSV